MELRTGPVAALLFCSGFCALVYQVGWLREFRLIFGASTASSAAVLAIFIGGLGAGGLLLGRRVDRHPRPLLFYSNLELVVAVTAALSPFLLGLARAIYLASGGSIGLGMPIATIERLILSGIVLAVPTLAMGGTLPAAARAVTRVADLRRQNLATLYAANTLGAVAGCLAATFFLLEIYGTRATLWLAAALNVLIAMLARVMDRRDREQRPHAADSVALEAGHGVEAPRSVQASDAAPPPFGPVASTTFLVIASATVGFAFFLMELVWYRLLGPLLGGSVFTFGLVLAVALSGIGLGGLLYSLIGRDRPASLTGFAMCCLLEAAAVAATFALGDRMALLALILLPLRTAGFAAAIGGWTLVTMFVVLVPAIIAGYQFPMLIALFGRGRERLGRDVGLAYAANTAGAIVGSLAGGFGLLPWLSAPGAWRLVAVVLVVLGVTAAILEVKLRVAGDRTATSGTTTGRVMQQLRASSPVSVLALASVTLLLLTAVGPTAIWRHSGIGAGRGPDEAFTDANGLRAWRHAQLYGTIWEGDGVESSVSLAVKRSGYAFVVNGKVDGNAREDAGTQVVLGLLAAMRHPHPRRAMVIGLGTGSTAGWLGAIPSMERVDVIELEPLVIDVARACAPVNQDVLRNPKVRITIGDARETLLTSRDRYDVIASEPSNPFRAGIASLFTVEYYRAARDRLTEDGAFAQWVQGYEIDAPTLRTIYATMAAVFPYVETWQTSTSDFALIASTRPRAFSTAVLRARIAEEPYKSALAGAWRATDVNGLLAHFVATDALTRAFAATPGVEINTDDRNVVEFGLARSVGRAAGNLTGELRNLARSTGASRPPLDSEAGISWPAVDTAWAHGVGWVDREYPLSDPPVERLRRTALQRYFRAGDLVGAREIWLAQSEPPRDPWELAMAADLMAETGSDAALRLIEQLRAYQPAEADTLLATLRMRQSRFPEAAAALVAAFARYRVDPWPLLRYKEKALSLALVIGRSDPSTARALYDALRSPFSVLVADGGRLSTAAELSSHFDFAGACREPIGAMEPYPPWGAEFLIRRRDCYRAANDPRLAAALRDLEDFFAHEPAPLARRP
jgi:spermidine synthase